MVMKWDKDRGSGIKQRDSVLEDELTRRLRNNKARQVELEARIDVLRNETENRPDATLEGQGPGAEWRVGVTEPNPFEVTNERRQKIHNRAETSSSGTNPSANNRTHLTVSERARHHPKAKLKASPTNTNAQAHKQQHHNRGVIEQIGNAQRQQYKSSQESTRRWSSTVASNDKPPSVALGTSL